MGDPHGEFTKALDMNMLYPDGPASVGIVGRCKRHAFHAVNGEIKSICISEKSDDPAGDNDPSATLSEAVIAAIKAE